MPMVRLPGITHTKSWVAGSPKPPLIGQINCKRFEWCLLSRLSDLLRRHVQIITELSSKVQSPGSCPEPLAVGKVVRTLFC